MMYIQLADEVGASTTPNVKYMRLEICQFRNVDLAMSLHVTLEIV